MSSPCSLSTLRSERPEMMTLIGSRNPFPTRSSMLPPPCAGLAHPWVWFVPWCGVASSDTVPYTASGSYVPMRDGCVCAMRRASPASTCGMWGLWMCAKVPTTWKTRSRRRALPLPCMVARAGWSERLRQRPFRRPGGRRGGGGQCGVAGRRDVARRRGGGWGGHHCA